MIGTTIEGRFVVDVSELQLGRERHASLEKQIQQTVLATILDAVDTPDLGLTIERPPDRTMGLYVTEDILEQRNRATNRLATLRIPLADDKISEAAQTALQVTVDADGAQAVLAHQSHETGHLSYSFGLPAGTRSLTVKTQWEGAPEHAALQLQALAVDRFGAARIGPNHESNFDALAGGLYRLVIGLEPDIDDTPLLNGFDYQRLPADTFHLEPMILIDDTLVMLWPQFKAGPPK